MTQLLNQDQETNKGITYYNHLTDDRVGNLNHDSGAIVN